MDIKMVVLTKSAKGMRNGSFGNCVAGFDEQGKWVRLVWDESGDSLPDTACSGFNCLDVIDVDITTCPLPYHPENVRLMRFNGRVDRLTIDRVVQWVDIYTGPYCFVNTYNALDEFQRGRVKESLMLIRVDQLRIYKDERGKAKAEFIYNRHWYRDISITDNRNKKEASYDEAYVVMSLPAEPYSNGYYYKFIAAVYAAQQ